MASAQIVPLSFLPLLALLACLVVPNAAVALSGKKVHILINSAGKVREQRTGVEMSSLQKDLQVGTDEGIEISVTGAATTEAPSTNSTATGADAVYGPPEPANGTTGDGPAAVRAGTPTTAANATNSTADSADSLSGTWLYGEGKYTYNLTKLDPQNYSFEERYGTSEITGVLKRDGEWYAGPVSRDGRPYGSMRVRPSGGFVISNYRAENSAQWGQDIIASPPELETTTTTTTTTEDPGVWSQSDESDKSWAHQEHNATVSDSDETSGWNFTNSTGRNYSSNDSANLFHGMWPR